MTYSMPKTLTLIPAGVLLGLDNVDVDKLVVLLASSWGDKLADKNTGEPLNSYQTNRASHDYYSFLVHN